MAENKKGFVLYADLINSFEDLTNEEAGELIKLILDYVNDKNPTTENRIVKIAFTPIRNQLKRDLKKYELKKQQWSDAGKRSAESKKKSTESTDVKTVATESTVKDTVKVTVTDKVIVKDIVTVTHNENLIEIFFKDLENCSDLQTIAMNNRIDVDWVKSQIPLFRAKAELTYPNFQRFTSHFKNFIHKELEKKINGQQGNKNSGKASTDRVVELAKQMLAGNNGHNG